MTLPDRSEDYIHRVGRVGARPAPPCEFIQALWPKWACGGHRIGARKGAAAAWHRCGTATMRFCPALRGWVRSSAVPLAVACTGCLPAAPPERADALCAPRPGRAGALGLAFSLVATVPEKVWFCTVKGAKPWERPTAADVRDRAQGGHTVWYDEPGLLQARPARRAGARCLRPPLWPPSRGASGGTAGRPPGSWGQAARRRGLVRRHARCGPGAGALTAGGARACGRTSRRA